MQAAFEMFTTLQVPHEVKTTLAHRTHAYVKDAEQRGCAIFIAAHLAGTVAGLTNKPVIGIPIDTGPMR